MEMSALWIVFPLLDQLVENRPFSPWITAWNLGIALFALTGGILLRKGVSE
jgi:lipopolysaccharide export LptBFGC system permease protein LptF